MKSLAHVVCLGAALTIASSAKLSAQSIPAFDVTSIKPSPPGCAAEPGVCRTFVGPAGGRYTPGTPLQMSIRGVGVPLSLLAKTVGQAIGAMVVDRTGLNGLYDFETELAMDPQLAMRQIAQTGAALPADAVQPGDNPAMSTILQQRLGLKLETQRAPITFVVIDSAEQPSAN